MHNRGIVQKLVYEATKLLFLSLKKVNFSHLEQAWHCPGFSTRPLGPCPARFLRYRFGHSDARTSPCSARPDCAIIIENRRFQLEGSHKSCLSTHRIDKSSKKKVRQEFSKKYTESTDLALNNAGLAEVVFHGTLCFPAPFSIFAGILANYSRRLSGWKETRKIVHRPFQVR